MSTDDLSPPVETEAQTLERLGWTAYERHALDALDERLAALMEWWKEYEPKWRAAGLVGGSVAEVRNEVQELRARLRTIERWIEGDPDADSESEAAQATMGDHAWLVEFLDRGRGADRPGLAVMATRILQTLARKWGREDAEPPQTPAERRTGEKAPVRCGVLREGLYYLPCLLRPGHDGRHDDGHTRWENMAPPRDSSGADAAPTLPVTPVPSITMAPAGFGSVTTAPPAAPVTAPVMPCGDHDPHSDRVCCLPRGHALPHRDQRDEQFTPAAPVASGEGARLWNDAETIYEREFPRPRHYFGMLPSLAKIAYFERAALDAIDRAAGLPHTIRARVVSIEEMKRYLRNAVPTEITDG